ncbi:hypothetical protein BT96DRAFT_1004469 [Gymnopus androsaceus JB14]|uniref:Uncharacterized protein n=1 Tax=Gymnopus androsaceus JB14 TaxID=1447944 RepID=A0A6A4GSE8_9AGAR|nr:hypothetical protein BT96DRAFT_1004469 [Gymnopus androsaceus JB14]
MSSTTAHPAVPTEIHMFKYPHALVDDHIFTIHGGNEISFPFLPSPEDALSASSASMGNMHRLNWISSSYPYLLLIPEAPFAGCLFDCLRPVHHYTAPTHQLPDLLWCLEPGLMVEWAALESNMRQVLLA